MTNLVGIHDREAAGFSPSGTWILDTIALSENPAPQNYSTNHSWIGRVNWGYGSTGTIPLDPGLQNTFIQRFVGYVKASKNCWRWVIGNEPNLSREWPDGKPIYPDVYATFFRRCRDALASAGQHEVLVAGSGPWNNELKYAGNSDGDWVKYFADVLSALGRGWDGAALHAYTHGYDPALVASNATMDSPFQNRFYNFHTYWNYVNVIPEEDAHKSFYLTESNGNGPWQATGLMRAMASDVNAYNVSVKNRKIKSLIFYRFPHYDDFYIQGKSPVEQEYKSTAALNFESPAETSPAPAPVDPYPNAPKATVQAAVLNVRDKAGTVGSNVIGQKVAGEKISILQEKNVDDDLWYRIGPNQWVIAEWTDRKPPTPTQPVLSDWDRARKFTASWEGGFQNVKWDPGNWDSCQVGKGNLIGTNFGISACAHPGLDIKNLTREQADKIYFEEYWKGSGADKLAWPMNLIVFDTAINFGVTNAVNYLRQSKGDPLLYMALRLRGYRHSAAWPQAGNAWVDRTTELMLEASAK